MIKNRNVSLNKTTILRLVLIIVIIISFVILSNIFISQYRQYKQVENRLNIAYSNNAKLSPVLYELFSTFSEVDNLFRLYAISFDKTSFNKYQDKLDTLSHLISKIDSIPNEYDSSLLSKDITFMDSTLSNQYIILKKQIDKLIIFANDSLVINNISANNNINFHTINADSVINRILNDTLVRMEANADTIIKKKDNLFNRIFNAKNDTLLNTKNSAFFNANQIDIIHKNIENLIRTNEGSYKSKFSDLRRIYLNAKEKEKKLIFSNYELINDLKKSIEAIQELEYQKFRSAEKNDYLHYRYNTQKFRTYAIMALCVILLMLIYIIYYQYVVSSYEKKIIKEKEYASKLAEEKTNLLANISHEIRTPLNSLKGVVKLLTGNKAKDIDDTLLNNINYDINLINNTVNDILNLSKIESGTIKVNLDNVFLSKIINDTFNLHHYQAEQKGLKFINENLLKDSFSVISNEFRLRQILSNLISNAIKYTPKGSVKVQSKIIKEKIIIEVIDTGIGIDDKKLDQIFRKYFTVDGEKNKVGFGLGLHISQLLAQQIGGKLTVKSKLQEGSTFTLQIPLNPQNKSKAKITDDSSASNPLPLNASIVIIDDNKINLLLAKQMFSNFSNIHLFEDAEKAIRYIEDNSPDIVITDIIMPNFSGWDVLRKIKSNNSLLNTKVFANTAEQILAENKIEPYSFDGILNKGFNLDDLSKIYNSK